jgi:hypothetical protein
MDLSWISALAPWLLTRETALLLVGGFVASTQNQSIASYHIW